MEQLVAIQRAIYTAISADLASFASTRNWWALVTVLSVQKLQMALHAKAKA